MSIVAAELKLYKSATVTDTSANGGKMSNNEIVDGVKNNLLPDVSQAERIAGLTRHRKLFAKVANDDDDTLSNAVLHLKSFTPGQDRVELFEATQIDTYGDVTGTERKYGAGALLANVSAGGTVITMTLEDTSQAIFNTSSADNVIYITDGTNEEYHEDVAASKSGTTITLTLDTGDQLANAYTTANNSIVASCVQQDDVECTDSGTVATTAGSGDYDDATYPPEGDNIATIEDTWTLTFTSASAFSCAGAATGAVAAGNTSSDFAPPNSAQSNKPFFTLLSAGWTGAWATGDTLVFTTHPAAKGMWAKQIVPAGCSSYSGDNFDIRFGGESA